MKAKTSKPKTLDRRQLLLAGAIAGSVSLAGPSTAHAAGASTLPVRGGGPEIFSRFGVKPFINCTSTYTINGGSAMLPEVIEAMNSAAFYPVNFDELMDAAGKRLAELLQVEAAMVSSGTAGAMTCATLACVAGCDPEKMQQLPDTTGLKSEVVVPRWSRSVYDHAVRSTGVKMIEVETLTDLERAFGPKTAMATGQVNMANEGRGLRDRAILAVLLGCGLRRSEVAALTLAHIQQRDGRWCVVDLVGKHARVRTVPMPTWVKVAIDAWTAPAGVIDGRVFRSVNRGDRAQGEGMSEKVVWQMLRRYAAAIGIPGLAPHDARRTCAKLCRAAGGELEQIQLLLGHASVQTTERYLGTRQDLVHAPNDGIKLKVAM